MIVVECKTLEDIKTFVASIRKEGETLLFRGTGSLIRPYTDMHASGDRPIDIPECDNLSEDQKLMLDGWLGEMPNAYEAIKGYSYAAEGLLGSNWWKRRGMTNIRKMRCIQQMGLSTYLLDVSKEVTVAAYFATCGSCDCDCGVYVWKVKDTDLVSYKEKSVERTAEVLLRNFNIVSSANPLLCNTSVITVDGDELSWEKAQQSAYIFTPRKYNLSKKLKGRYCIEPRCDEMIQPDFLIKISKACKKNVNRDTGHTKKTIYPGAISKNLQNAEYVCPGLMQDIAHSIKKAIDKAVASCDEDW